VAEQKLAIVTVDAASQENVANWGFDCDRASWTLIAVLQEPPKVLGLEEFERMALEDDSHGYRKTDPRQHGVRPAQQGTPSSQSKVPPA
jgi:hypothetical protein